MNIANVEVSILDTTLRDGAQALPVEHQFKTGDKPAIADHIARLGIQVIEAGFPATPSDAVEVAEVASTVGQTSYLVDAWNVAGKLETSTVIPVIAGLSRTTNTDIEVTWDAIQSAKRPRIHTFVSTDAAHMAAKFPGKSSEQVLEMGRQAVRFARQISSGHPGADVEFSAEAASTTDTAYLERVVKDTIQEGANVINVPDTVGQRDPWWMYQFYGRVIDWAMQINPAVTISSHNHNDLGNAVANTGVLVRAAAAYAAMHDQQVRVQLEGTVCGLGERAGNADLFPVMAGIFKFAPDMEASIAWHGNPSHAVRSARAVMGYAGMDVPRQSPIVGSDTNVHRSGIHSDGVIKGGYMIYSAYDPTFWGHSLDAVHEDGKYQGKTGRRAALES